ncbi:MAG: hypothetical protein HC898_05990 [Phycisphaerales bacterium]|nr:hypothetical protein [Phycisphaerales bacterium]
MEIVLRDSNAVGSEWEMVTRHIRTDSGDFNWAGADKLVDFATKYNFPFFGHDFLHNDIPPFMTAITDRSKLIDILQEHIHTVATRYRGRVPYWHIGTELFTPEGMRDTHWHQIIGPEYLDLALKFAHEADPDALIMLNEARMDELSPYSDRVYHHVASMLDRGVPLQGMGFHAFREATWGADDSNIQSMKKNWQRFADLGLKIFITEMGMYISDISQYDIQARAYKNVIRAALEMRPYFKGFIIFGLADHPALDRVALQERNPATAV